MDNFYAYIPLILKYIVILPYFLKDSKQVLRIHSTLNYLTPVKYHEQMSTKK
ncbi:hypothetical protein [Spiroplasma ixodetis]|uniref:hypothetical protein n=1 Tax=Spiroplasma ixodetis TaxID=2141 RepID=UPI0024915CC7|nr:hypothetical protein [Spiroplasma ixodetis]